MRIIAGSCKGARIFAPRGPDTRPTGDRVREAAFNLIGPVDGARVLDLFAGSGAMALEALSRGAASAVLVESDREALRAIERNVSKLALGGAEVARVDAVRRVREDAAAGRRYDLVLIDPPYAMLETALARLAPHLPLVLAPDGVVVVESAAGLTPELPLAVRTSRRYGRSRLTLFEARSR